MKRFFTILSGFIMVANLANAQIINFPDANFKAAIIKAYPAVDSNKDSQISQDEAKSLTSIRNLANYPNIYDATGIEYFTNLTELNLGDLINLNKIDLSQNTKLTTLNLRKNKLVGTLDISSLSNLTNLDLNNNQLSEVIFPTNSKLKIVYINDNQLTSIDLSELKDLQRLFLVNNQLSNLNFSQNINLERIHINGNQLTSLNLSGLTKLNWFSAESNILSNITFSNNPLLKTILVKNNQLISFDFMDGFVNNITLINIEANTGFKLIKKDCNDSIVVVSGTFVQDNCATMSTHNFDNKAINIYPSLVNNIINVRNADFIVDYQIFDTSGKILKSDSLRDSAINVDFLPKGNYILIITTKNKVTSHSFIKL